MLNVIIFILSTFQEYFPCRDILNSYHLEAQSSILPYPNRGMQYPLCRCRISQIYFFQSKCPIVLFQPPPAAARKKCRKCGEAGVND